jgi:hypothetical protein
MKYYMIDQSQLNRLARIATRLYTERRMNGDDMRDAAQTLDAVVRLCQQLQIPGEDKD